MEYFTKNYHPPGTAPGTLVEHETTTPAELSIRLIDYTETDYEDIVLNHADECRPYLERDSITWIHFQGQTQAEALKRIGELFDLHALAMEDVLNRGQRPKVEEYEGQLFVILAMPTDLEGSAAVEQVSIFLGEKFVISFHNGWHDPFEPLRTRLEKHSGRFRSQKADYLLYTLLDLVIDQGFPVLEMFGEQIEALENELLDSPNKQTLEKIHEIKRELLLLRRMLWPQRDVLNYLMRGDQKLISDSTLLYLRDCYDHSVHIIDLLENYRDMTASMLDVYLSSVSHRLNEVMQLLTIIATIFIPLTFIVGVYGMNFHNPDSPWSMPELSWYYGYPLVWIIMIVVVIGMLAYFKRKEWL